MRLTRFVTRWSLYLHTRPGHVRLLLVLGPLFTLAGVTLLFTQLPGRSSEWQLFSAGGPELPAALLSRCPPNRPNRADIHAETVFPTLNFSAEWVKKKTFWNTAMETRFQGIKAYPKHRLKILVVPHSHNDPGWGWTFEAYYKSRSRLVLDAIVHMMPQLPNMRFMWTEISFLQIWWNQASEEKRKTLTSLIASGRLEITTGGWVMTDEAVTRLSSIVSQLVEGHTWLRSTLNVSVNTGWSVDPFGHGSTVPYVLKQAGINQAVILRTPYVWKEYLAAKQSGDFFWQQQWDTEGETSVLTHHHPYFMYTTSAACGPFGESSKMCFNFDFARDWSEPVAWYRQFTHVTEDNIQERAEMLVDAAGRTASLYPHNVVLMMLGADFQFKHDFEWREQYGNYSLLMRYINGRQDLHAEISFATPAEYFAAVRERVDADARPATTLPSFVGDFHVYSDVFNAKPKYWSGYYTTGPHWKRAGRQLESQLLAVEQLFSWSWSAVRRLKATEKEAQLFQYAYKRLGVARKNVALFGHHDAITGTSSDIVMADFMGKLEQARDHLDTIFNFVVTSLLLELGQFATSLEVRDAYHSLQQGLGVLQDPPLVTLKPKQPRRLVVFNPLPVARVELLELYVSTHQLQLLDSSGASLPLVVSPGENSRVSFLVTLAPQALHFYTLQAADSRDSRTSALNVTERRVMTPPVASFRIANSRFSLLLNASANGGGVVQSLRHLDSGREIQLGVRFGAFRTRPRENGKYLFGVTSETPLNLPCDTDSWLRAESPISSAVRVSCGPATLMVELLHGAGAMEQAVRLSVDLRITSQFDDRDVFMAIDTDLKSHSGDGAAGFYTDCSDYVMARRVWVPEAGVPGNVYPVTTQASLQEASGGRRVSLLMDRSRGVGSLQEGSLTVMLDRRSSADDDRGIGQSNRANRLNRHQFLLVLGEAPKDDEEEDRQLFASSPLENLLAQQLNQPGVARVSRGQHAPPPALRQLLTAQLPCDWQLVQLRQLSRSDDSTAPSDTQLLTLLRRPLQCSAWSQLLGCSPPAATTSARFSAELGVTRLVPCALNGADPRWHESVLDLNQLNLPLNQLSSFLVLTPPAPRFPVSTQERHSTPRAA